MLTPRRHLLAAGSLLLLAAATAWAEPAVESAATADPHVYTNADLLRMFGPPTEAAPAAGPAVDEAGWQPVVEFIERQHARLEAQRGYELARTETQALVEVEEEPPQWRAPRGYYFSTLPWLLGSERCRTRIGGNGHRDPQCNARVEAPAPDGDGGAAAGSGLRYVPPTAGPAGRIVPLHARPAPR